MQTVQTVLLVNFDLCCRLCRLCVNTDHCAETSCKKIIVGRFRTQNDWNSKLLELETFGAQNFWNSTLLELNTFGTQNFWNSELLDWKPFGLNILLTSRLPSVVAPRQRCRPPPRFCVLYWWRSGVVLRSVMRGLALREALSPSNILLQKFWLANVSSCKSFGLREKCLCKQIW